ncbi:hypothetical protein E2I00_013552, partial [Balaenoptera physalus]
MKLNISFLAIGCQKLIENRTAKEVAADTLGEEWKGYVVRISGGNDKQGFPIKQSVLTHGHIRLLLSKGHSCYRPRRTGERIHKSVWGCTVDANLSGLNLVFVKKREKNITGLIDTTKSRTKAHKVQCPFTPCALQHKRRCIALKKQHSRKTKAETAEYAKLLAKRMKEVKEKCREQ